MFSDKTILVTGGTGSFGKVFTRYILENCNPKKVIIYSRDEYKQYVMQEEFSSFSGRMRFFIGDVRDRERMYRALDGVDVVVHAAALKQVPAAEYNPLEAIKTNIYGAQNIIDAAIDRNVDKVIALSTDKAVHPVNLYGATKLVSDKLFTSANAYSGSKRTTFSVVRYGNVAGSRGSVIPFFRRLVDSGARELPITDFRMTRFWITLEQGVQMVIRAINESKGGEIYVAKIPSFRVTDLAEAMLPEAEQKEIGIREGEKLHEEMITMEDSRTTYEYDNYFIIYPNFNWWDNAKHFTPGGALVDPEFHYKSDTNEHFLTIEELRSWSGRV
ncbi:UDP-N-acetylglucosamine 4,6-dehydratase (inverting) [Limisalsivibrio acetivorans]|uniref:UDP-N-acetylglucosamine 4,6-dehydratase (inverting) n=1 Tax=Limisalsivibrio acetivorans TaxID=1304888 RepID=UPI0003B72C4F|nr:UDP-N-acetylglucosamine 4,6-dehydratase (inverting) [Limisalsivibrio acetivorans]